jgi:hypothetical protein
VCADYGLFPSFTATAVGSIFAQILLAGGQSPETSCNVPWSPTTFYLPDVFTTWAASGNGNLANIDIGIRMEDINDDGLVDLLKGFDDSGIVVCIWLNTGCGWVPQANYTGPITTCLPAAHVIARGVSFSWTSTTTVGAFIEDVRGELFSSQAPPRPSAAGGSDDDVWVEWMAKGVRHSRGTLIETAARHDGGFVLHIGAEKFPFSRGGGS